MTLVSDEASKSIQGTSSLSFANSAANGIKNAMAPAVPAPVDAETREDKWRGRRPLIRRM